MELKESGGVGSVRRTQQEDDGTDVGKGEDRLEPGQEGHPRPGPGHIPEEPRPPRTRSPVPTDPAVFALLWDETVWHLIDS